MTGKFFSAQTSDANEKNKTNQHKRLLFFQNLGKVWDAVGKTKSCVPGRVGVNIIVGGRGSWISIIYYILDVFIPEFTISREGVGLKTAWRGFPLVHKWILKHLSFNRCLSLSLKEESQYRLLTVKVRNKPYWKETSESSIILQIDSLNLNQIEI